MNQLIMIILISLLVLVHEAGHYIAARLCNVRVTRFGIGMPIGPSWKLFKLNHTTFYIHAFLFGGYVSFADDEENFIKEEKEKNPNSDNIDEDEILPPDSDELYENKSIAQKLFIVSAGVIMNVVFAIILVMFCALYFHKLPTSNQNIYVDSFSPKVTSNVQQQGIVKGDRIIKINNENVNNLYQLTFFAKNSKMFDDYAQESLIEKNSKELKRLNPNIKDVISKNTVVKLPVLHEENYLEVNEDVLKGLEKYKKDGVKLSENQINLRNEIIRFSCSSRS